MVVISAANNHLVYASYASLILLTAADGWFGTALMGGLSFAVLWAAGTLFPNTVFSFMLVLFPRIIAIGISMRTLIGRNEASRTLAALRNMHLPERFIMIVAVIFRFFPGALGDMKLLRQSIHTRGAFATPWQMRALPSYIEILTVPWRCVSSASRRRSRLRRDARHRPQAPQEQLSVSQLFRVGRRVMLPAGGVRRRRSYSSVIAARKRPSI